ncbi:MAG: hypothetical protein JSS79_07665 [Bacteroidetes bacterium]|nr:hypothetical protein [Bacteroidota bacterium]
MIFMRLILLLLLAFQLSAQTSEPTAKNKWIEKRLGLAALPDHCHEIILRIFLDPGTTNSGHVLELSKANGVWKGMKYDYFLRISSKGTVGKIKRVNRCELKSNDWEVLWMKLEKLNVLTLPDQQDIKDKLRTPITSKRGKGYEVISVLDGSSYDLMVMKDTLFSYYSFHSPWVYAEKYPAVDEVKMYTEIISVIEQEFSIKFRN